MIRVAAKKFFFIGPSTKKKERFLRIEKKICFQNNVATKLGGGKALVAGPLKKNLFCGFLNSDHVAHACGNQMP